ncbi:hypothetical protein BKN38_08015 [Helicobacter sp. CLO-3]|nr:hypothetical protein BA723_05195 [Helicobacter sp. CLO-3]OHU81898.1 hypothetical protein BKN38_08015 [Helicobacter sp. CLO-3]
MYEKLEKLLRFSSSDLASSCKYDASKDSLKITQALEKNIKKHNDNLSSKLQEPRDDIRSEQSEYFAKNLAFEYGESPNEAELKDLLDTIKKRNKDFNADFYIKEAESSIKDTKKGKKNSDLDSTSKNKNIKPLYKNALNQWKELIESKLTEHQEQIIKQSQGELIKRTKEWLEFIQKMQDTIDDLGEAGEMFGKSIMQSLRDGLESGKSLSEYLGEGSMTPKSNEKEHKSSIGQNLDSGNLQRKFMNLEKWLKILQQDSVKKLCEMLGRFYKEEKKLEMEFYSSMTTFSTKIPTPYAKEEISGITLGRDLENILPQELALLDDEDFGILFDLKFVENRLFCFEKQGYEDTINQKEVTNEREKETTETKGPIILCIDTSGSMSGEPETIAKAIALFMARIAMEQKRACYLISFSTGIYTLDLTPPNGLFELMSFLEMSFNGGTDAIPAIQEGFRKMQDEAYKKADMLVISDFVFGGDDERRIAELMKQKDEQNKCYALYIGAKKA